MSDQALATTRPSTVDPVRFGREMTTNLLLAGLFSYFAMHHVFTLLDGFRLSVLLLLIKVSTDVFFYLIRRVPKDVSISLYDWAIAIAGTFCVMFFRPAAGADSVIGQGLQFAGIGLQVFAMFSLNRSIGIVAANRGVQTNGLYRFVRHPLYFSYVIAFGGFVVSHPSAFNLCVYVSAFSLWVLRLLAEERFLLKDEAYQEYSQKVRSRILPFIF